MTEQNAALQLPAPAAQQLGEWYDGMDPSHTHIYIYIYLCVWMHAAYYKSTSTRRCQHLYINSHNSDPLWVKKIKYIRCSYIFLLLLLKVAVSAAALHPWLQLCIYSMQKCAAIIQPASMTQPSETHLSKG